MDRASLLSHLSAVRSCLEPIGGVATLDAFSLVLTVRARNRYFHLTPQFIESVGGRIRYALRLTNDSTGFAGWMPYFNKQWTEARDKLAFKAACLEGGIATPAFDRSAMDHAKGFIIKPARASSFGRGISGPFRPGSQPPSLAEGDYPEAFITGTILKAWFWDDTLAVLEAFPFPTVQGDGSRPLQALLQPMLPRGHPRRLMTRIVGCLAWQGLTLDDVVEPGRNVIVDFRYGSGLFIAASLNSNRLAAFADSPVLGQLRTAGAYFLSRIPGDLRPGVVFTLDAVVDESEHVWFLEINCNPTVHPDVYPMMFDALFAQDGPPRVARLNPPIEATSRFLPPPPGMAAAATLPPEALAPAPSP
jgi:hypothetical protein